VKISHNYNFSKTNSPIQFEGEEDEVQPEQIGTELVRKRKCTMVENPDISPRRSNRPKTQHDYAKLIIHF